MEKIQQTVVAGMFYPSNPTELNRMIKNFLIEAKGSDTPIPKAIISPHAGYIYSGLIAASAYSCLSKAKGRITNVVVIAPSHSYPFFGIGFSSADIFMTPLGAIKVNKEAIVSLSKLPNAILFDQIYQKEHSLEVQLPFLQLLLGDFTLVPILVGDMRADEIAKFLEVIWGGKETLIVVSSDLSHYHDYVSAKKIDERTVQNILNFKYDSISGDDACGYVGVCGLLKIAAEKKLRSALIDLRNSGDTQGEKEQVVGYGAFHFYEEG